METGSGTCTVKKVDSEKVKAVPGTFTDTKAVEVIVIRKNFISISYRNKFQN